MAKNIPAFLQTKRIFSAPCHKVFQAWTEPDKLKKWWRVGDNWSTPIAEVDLRVGGTYRFGMQSPEGEITVVSGQYREIIPLKKLVFTWKWEQKDDDVTMVTIEFIDRKNKTEVILKHENFTSSDWQLRHEKGWRSCMDQLEKQLGEIS